MHGSSLIAVFMVVFVRAGRGTDLPLELAEDRLSPALIDKSKSVPLWLWLVEVAL